MNSEPSSTLFIDDRIENVSGARSVGLDSVQYRSVEELGAQLDSRGLL